jgi:hypothetical protein
MEIRAINSDSPRKIDYKKIDLPEEVLLTPANDLVLHTCITDMMSKTDGALLQGHIGDDKIHVEFKKVENKAGLPSIEMNGTWGSNKIEGAIFPQSGELVMADTIGDIHESGVLSPLKSGFYTTGYSDDVHIKQQLLVNREQDNRIEIASQIGDYTAVQMSADSDQGMLFAGKIFDKEGKAVSTIKRTVRGLQGGGFEIKGDAEGTPIEEYLTPMKSRSLSICQ